MSTSRVLLVLVAALLLAVGSGGVRAADDEKDEDNPHEKMVRSKAACLECHSKVPNVGDHAADYFLVDTPSEHCLGCHDENEHVGVQLHLGKEAAPLPADEKGKIACFTCHDPHPQGVLAGRTVHRAGLNEATQRFLAARTLPAGVTLRKSEDELGALLRYSMADGEGCRQCHVAKEESWRSNLLPSHFMRVWPDL
jgi:hypothetical protein